MYHQAKIVQARLAIASLTMQNIGGDSVHPIVSIIRTVMSCSSSSNLVGIAPASLSVIEGEWPTLKKVLARSYLLGLTILYHEFASTSIFVTLSWAFPNCIDSCGLLYL